MRVISNGGDQPVSRYKVDAGWGVFLTHSCIVEIDVEVKEHSWAYLREALTEIFTKVVIRWAHKVALAFTSVNVEILVSSASWCDQLHLAHALA